MSDAADKHRCWAEIDCDALRHNTAQVRARVGSAEILAVVKANAYGHGILGVSEALAQDVQLFGVANLEEAVALRERVPHPIMVLGPALPDELVEIAQRRFIATISSLAEAEQLSRSGSAVSQVAFKIDTGMGRMGVNENDALDVFKSVAALPKIKIHSVSTHLPVADGDAHYTREELSRFASVVKRLRAEVAGDYKVHALQSAGVLAFASAPPEIVRAGIMLYGISPIPDFQKDLRPVMTWKTRIALIRDLPKGASISYGRTFITPRAMRVGTLTAGYADGYPRHLSNRDAAVLVSGERCALLGRVTMDLMVVDLSNVKTVDVGDEAVLMGKQGAEEISAHELAERAGTITWEITTRIGSRVRRVFL